MVNAPSQIASNSPVSPEKSGGTHGVAAVKDEGGAPDEPDDTNHDAVPADVIARDYSAEPSAAPEAVLSRRHLAVVDSSALQRKPSATITRPTLIKDDRKKIGPEPTWRQCATHIFKYSPLNLLLLFIPISWAVHFAHVGDVVIFVMSFLAIIPCAALLGFATEEIAIRLGPTLGGIANVTLGNTVELIVTIIALLDGRVGIVQSAMVGSILSNCLLVLGCCFFAGGLRFHEQGYEVRSAQLQINLLGLSVLALVVPAAFSVALRYNRDTPGGLNLSDAQIESSILKISRGTSVILIFVYISYLVLMLYSHRYLYRPDPEAAVVLSDLPQPQPPENQRVFRLSMPSWPSSSSGSGSRRDSVSSKSTDTGVEEPKLKLWAAVALLVAVTVLAGVTAEFMVSSIDGFSTGAGVTQEFVALILLPLVGNAAEHITAVTVSVKGKVDLAMAVAVGSSIQIALLVLPFLVLLAWMIGQPLSLNVDTLEILVLFIAVIMVTNAIGDGRSNWVEGLALICAYVIIAVVAFFYPVRDVLLSV